MAGAERVQKEESLIGTMNDVRLVNTLAQRLQNGYTVNKIHESTINTIGETRMLIILNLPGYDPVRDVKRPYTEAPVVPPRSSDSRRGSLPPRYEDR